MYCQQQHISHVRHTKSSAVDHSSAEVHEARLSVLGLLRLCMSKAKMQSQPKSDTPLTHWLLTQLSSRFQPRPQATSAEEPAQFVKAAIPAKTARVRYTATPVCQVACRSAGDPLTGLANDIGIRLVRSSSPLIFSISVPSLLSVHRSERAAAGAPAARKRLTDPSSQARWFSRMPVVTAEHNVSYNRVHKLLLKGSLDCNSHKYSADATWFVKWEGQPAKLRFNWNESNPGLLLFDAQVAVRAPTYRLRITGTPHNLHTASVILSPGAKCQFPAQQPSFDAEPLSVSSSSSGRGSRRSRHSNALQVGNEIEGGGGSSTNMLGQSVSKQFEQPGLQLELGYNLLDKAPILSATRRFGRNNSNGSNSSSIEAASTNDSSSSSNLWGLKQVKAGYNSKGGNVSLSASGGVWSLGLAFPTEPWGPLGLPQPPRGGQSSWPRLMLHLSPDIDFDTSTGQVSIGTL